MVKKIDNLLNKKISNRLAYTIISAFTLILLGIFVYAQNIPNPGHSISQIGTPAGCSANQFLKWNGSSWTCSAVQGESIWASGENNNIYYKDGNVGIGTDIFSERLNIDGNLIIKGNLLFTQGSSITIPGQGTDTDRDGYYQQGTSYSTTIISSTGVQTTRYDGNDCYDSNALTHPGQLNYFDTQRGDGSFDYNCDGQIIYRAPNVDISNVCANKPQADWWVVNGGGNLEYSCSAIYDFVRREGGNPVCYEDLEICNRGQNGVNPTTRASYRR